MKSAQKLDTLINILDQSDGGQDPQLLSHDNAGFLAAVTPLDLAYAEQRMYESGRPIDTLRKRWGSHIRLLGDTAGMLRDELAPAHVLRKMLASHEMILCLMVDLNELAEAIAKLEKIETSAREYRQFVHIVSHVAASTEHFRIEEETIFPTLAEEGLTAVVDGFKRDHDELARCTEELLTLMYRCCTMNLANFKKEFVDLAGWLVPFKNEHIFEEDSFLYPVAHELIADPSQWQQLEAKCQTVGYCCFHSPR